MAGYRAEEVHVCGHETAQLLSMDIATWPIFCRQLLMYFVSESYAKWYTESRELKYYDICKH